MRRPLWAFLLLFALSVVLYLAGVYHVKSILWGDTRYYYAYTRSLVMDRDINFRNEAYISDVGFPNPPQVSEKTHLVTNKFSPGAPLLWIPGFVVGQEFTLAAHALKLPVRTDGYGQLTQFSTALSALCFSVAGLYVVFQIIKAEYGERIAWITNLFLYLATQMFYYTSLDPLNSHSASFLFSALLVLGVQKFLKGPRPISSAVYLGIVGGMLSLIRNQDAALMIPVGLMLLLTSRSLPQAITRGLTLTFSWFSIMSIQLLFTFVLYGQFNSPYLIQGEQILWLHPDFWRVLFTPQNGVLFFAPGLLLCIWGLMVGVRRKDQLCQIGLSCFLLELYVVAAWSPEILGGPYGSRMFISSLPWLAIGLGQLLKVKRWDQVPIWQLSGILGILAANNVAQTLYMLATH